MTSDEFDPFVVLGITQQAVAEANQRGGLAAVKELVTGMYRTQAKLYHTDVSADNADIMGRIAEANEELRDPEQLRVAVDFYVGAEVARRVARRRTVRQWAERSENLLAALAKGLESVDQLAVLGLEGPAEIVTELGFSADNPLMLDGAMIGEVSSRHLRLRSLVVPNGTTVDSRPPTYSEEKGVWLSRALVTPSGESATDYLMPGNWNEHADDYPLKATEPIPGDIRIVGGCRVDEAREAAEIFRSGEAQGGLEMGMGSRAAKAHVSWAPLQNAWWMSILRPVAEPGDYLVLIYVTVGSPLFALIGPWLAGRYLTAKPSST